MKTINDYLSPEQITKYEHEWANFKGKYESNTSKNTHSGLPIISLVYRFEDTQIFRAHIFSKRLRSFDPYYQADKCLQPFYHAQHYIMIGEQMYSACSKLIIAEEYNKKIAKEVPIEFNWKKPIFFKDNLSIELIRQEVGNIGKYQKEEAYFTFYSDKTGRWLSRMSANSFWQPRAFMEDIKKIKEGDNNAIDTLIRKIEAQSLNHKRLKNPRINLTSSRNELIKSLRKGQIPEIELLDYFSLWE